MATTAPAAENQQSGFFGWIERVGNKVPHPVLMFFYLIIGLMILSHILYLFGVSVTDEVITPVPRQQLADLRDSLGGSVVPYNPYTSEVVEIPEFIVQEQTFPVRSLLTADGLRHFFVSFLPNFSGFTVIGVTFLAMLGAGVAEQAGLMNALIRKLVAATPAGLLTFYDGLRRRHLLTCLRRRLPDPDPACCRCLRERWPSPPGWALGGLCWGGRYLHRQPGAGGD